MAPRALAQGGARVCSASLRRRPCTAPSFRAEAGYRRALRRADDRARLRIRPDQRSEQPLPPEYEGDPSRRSGRDAVRRRAHLAERLIRSVARLVPDRVLPFSAAQPRAGRPQVRESPHLARRDAKRVLREVYRARESGRFSDLYESLVVDDAAVERGVADGSLVVDVRLRDALRAIRLGQEFDFRSPTSSTMPPTPST